MLGPVTKITLNALPQPMMAGTAFTVTAIARDALNDPVTTYNAPATWSNLSGPGNFLPANPNNFVNGVSQTTATISVPFKNDKITVSSGGFTGSGGFFNVFGPLDHVSVEVPAGPIATGKAFTVTARARDTAENVLVTYQRSLAYVV